MIIKVAALKKALRLKKWLYWKKGASRCHPIVKKMLKNFSQKTKQQRHMTQPMALDRQQNLVQPRGISTRHCSYKAHHNGIRSSTTTDTTQPLNATVYLPTADTQEVGKSIQLFLEFYSTGFLIILVEKATISRLNIFKKFREWGGWAGIKVSFSSTLGIYSNLLFER